MTEKIFVSYADEDRDLVKTVLGALREHRIVTGEDVVILDPHDFSPGADMRLMIKDQINSASKVVIIVSDHSAKSEWVNYEAGMASALDKPIFVMGRKGSGKTDSFINTLGNVQSIEIGGLA